MRIAIIGTGNVGAVLGRRWAQGGHAVTFGSRRAKDADVLELVRAAGPDAASATPAEAAAGAEVVVLATPGGNVDDVVAGLSVGTDDSGAERIAKAVPGARVVKAFNTTGSANMENPVYPDGRLAMFVCGDDADACALVAGLAGELGFEPVDCGPLKSARYLEPMAMVWITMAYPLKNGPGFGFALLRRG